MGRKRNWSLEQQLLDGRIIEEGGCWLWRQQDKRGYGKLSLHYKTVDVHRAAASVYLGLALGGKELVLHKCQNKHCFNPEHLYIGTQSDNIRDSVRDKTHGNARKTECSHGHAYTEANTYWYEYNGWKCRYCRTCMKAKNDRNNKKRKESNESRKHSVAA